MSSFAKRQEGEEGRVYSTSDSRTKITLRKKKSPNLKPPSGTANLPMKMPKYLGKGKLLALHSLGIFVLEYLPFQWGPCLSYNGLPERQQEEKPELRAQHSAMDFKDPPGEPEQLQSAQGRNTFIAFEGDGSTVKAKDRNTNKRPV